MAREQSGGGEFRRKSGFTSSSETSKLYRIALEEIRQSLSMQLDELNGIRSRGVSFVAFIGAVTGFLVSTTVKSIHPDDNFRWLAAIATGLMIWSLIQSSRLLMSARKFAFKIKPSELIDEYIEAKDTPPDETELLSSLAENYAQRIHYNQPRLKKVRGAYNQIVGSGLLSLLVWTFIIWRFGTVGS